jgi:CRP/FNR family transcriptional regulator
MSRAPKVKVRTPSACATCPIRGRALFQPLSQGEVELVAHFRSEDRVVHGATDLYRQGEPCSELYTLFDGWAFLYKLLEDGRRQILKFCLPGDFLGFQPDLETPRVHSAHAVTDVALCVFPRPNLLHMFGEHPKLGISLTWITAHDQALSYEHLTNVGRRSAKERLAYLLLELFYRAREVTEPDSEGGIFFPLTQEHLADALGLTPIHVNRTLRELRGEGVVELGGRRLKVPDPGALEEELGFNAHLLRPRRMI